MSVSEDERNGRCVYCHTRPGTRNEGLVCEACGRDMDDQDDGRYG